MNTNQRIIAISLLLISIFISSCKPSIPTPMPAELPIELPTESPTSTPMPTNWNGIPIIPGAISSEEFMGDYRIISSTSTEEIVAYYNQEMVNLGWESDPSLTASGGVTDLCFKKGNEYVFFLITPEGNNNVIDIHPVQQE